MKTTSISLTLFLITIVYGCMENKNVPLPMQSDYPSPPFAAIIPDTLKEFGGQRIDNYYWLKDRSNPEVMLYLKAENVYCDTVMASTKELQNKLYEEMRGRIKEEDQSVPVLENGYYYYNRTEKDKQYKVYCRKKADTAANEEILFDVNKMAEGSKSYIFAGFEVSNDNLVAAYMFNNTGSYAEFSLKFRDLKTGVDLSQEISTIQNFTWANDNKTVFYVLASETLRPYRIYRHSVFSLQPDKLIYEETDEAFNVDIRRSRSKEFIYISSSSFTSTEYRYLKADSPLGEFMMFRPREKDVEYTIEHHKDKVFIQYKDPLNINSKIYEAPLLNPGDRSTWKEFLQHDPNVKIQDFDVFEKYLAVYIRKNGLDGITVIDLYAGTTKEIEFPEPVYTVAPMYTPEFSATRYRYSYSSLNRPVTVFDYDMIAGKSEKLKEQEIPGGFNADDYAVERILAPTSDSVKVPMAIVYKKGLKRNGLNPTLLYSYGSYAYNTDASFRSNVFSLVDRGFIFAIAQVRGGSEMGEHWYEDGKLMKKKNTFNDFIACSEYLIAEKYTSPRWLAINGGSAGGLLMGAVVNMRPNLYHVVIADVPFVDVVTTMLDETLPLTTQEYLQWGDPNNEEAYRYMISYSPYDNITAQNYPNILATTGWNDTQVLYHEPAKWVAKLRAMKTDENIILLRTNLDSGHGGATGRFDYLKEVAIRYAFILDRMGLE